MKQPRSPKRAAPPEFDVMEFLRPSDTDIKSALHSLIGPPPQLEPPPKLDPQSNLTPLSNLDPVVKSEPPANLEPPTEVVQAILAPSAAIVVTETPAINSLPPFKSTPPSDLRPHPKIAADAKLREGSNLVPKKKRNFAIREANTVAEGHSRAEHDVYESLWREATPQQDGSRLITIGMLALARLSGLSESNARINLRSLQRKLAVEEHSTFVCENSLGRTWRVFSLDQILERRRNAGLIWYMKRTLAVVFVDYETGSQINRGS